MPETIDYKQFDTTPYNPGDPGTMTKVPPAQEARPSIAEQRIELQRQKEQQVDQPMIDRLRGMEVQYTALANQRTPVPRDPQFTQPPPAPKFDFTEPIKALQNPGVLIATLGSFFSRAPMTAAMNAGGAAMEAYHKGEAEVFAQKREEWKENLEVALEKNKIAMQKLQNEWHKSDVAVRDRLARMQAIAAGEKMETVIGAIQGGHFEQLDKIFEGLQKADDAARLSLLKFEEQKEIARIRSGGETGLTDTAKAAAAERYLKTGVLPSGMGNASAIQRKEIMNRAAELAQERGIDQAELPKEWQKFKAAQVAIQRFQSGPQGNTIRSLDVVVGHLSTLRKLSEALQNGDLPRFNALAQIWAQETGSPVPTNFDAAKRIVGTEIIKALGVAGAGTEKERAEAADSFNRANSPAQLNGVIKDVVQPLLAGQLKGLRRQFETSTQLPGSEFDAMLGPDTHEFMGSGGTVAPPASKPTRQEWMKAAKAANPSASDKELTEFYNNKYGGD